MKIISKFKIGRVINWNHTDSILNWNQHYSDFIHADPNHINSNQPIPSYLTNIGSIHDSDYTWAREKILASPVNSRVHASPIFTYGSASEPPSPPYYSSAESVRPKVNPKPRNNPPNPVTNVPYDPDSHSTFSDSSFSESSDLSDYEYYK